MSNELICSALGVSPDRWPPDHYALLGLAVGEVQAAVVEQRVLDRMERLRKYQLAHPDAVTDAMNRLAQALVCLSDPSAKRAYDATVLPTATAPTLKTPAQEVPGPYELAAPEPTIAPVINAPRPSLPRSGEQLARRPWHTNEDARRLLYRRLSAARRLLVAWREVGDCLSNPRTKLGAAEAIEFVGGLMDVRDRSNAFDSFGLPSQAGSMVLGLARQPLPLSAFRHLAAAQRAQLAEDWRAGKERIAGIYDELLRAVRRNRRRAPRRAARQFARVLVTDALDLTLFVFGLAALVLAIWRTRY
jgi:hypothetical protein